MVDFLSVLEGRTEVVVIPNTGALLNDPRD